MTDITVSRELLNGKCLVDISLLRQLLLFTTSVDRPNSRGSWNPTLSQLRAMQDALRAALKQPAPVVKRTESGPMDFLEYVPAPVQEQQPVAEVIECGNSYAKVKLLGDAWGTTSAGDRFYAQPRKAVKLTHLSLGALDEIYRESFGLIDSRLVGDQIKFARAIEATVLKANGVTE